MQCFVSCREEENTSSFLATTWECPFSRFSSTRIDQPRSFVARGMRTAKRKKILIPTDGFNHGSVRYGIQCPSNDVTSGSILKMAQPHSFAPLVRCHDDPTNDTMMIGGRHSHSLLERVQR